MCIASAMTAYSFRNLRPGRWANSNNTTKPGMINTPNIGTFQAATNKTVAANIIFQSDQGRS